MKGNDKAVYFIIIWMLLTQHESIGTVKYNNFPHEKREGKNDVPHFLFGLASSFKQLWHIAMPYRKVSLHAVATFKCVHIDVLYA